MVDDPDDVEVQAFPGSKPLADLQTFVQQKEMDFGHLQSLGSAGGNNIVTILIGDSPDTDHLAQLATYTGATPPAKTGFTVVCTGSCLVSDAVQRIVAYRKTP